MDEDGRDGCSPEELLPERSLSPSGREDTPPAPCVLLCGPRSCSTLPPSLSPSHASAGEPKRRRIWGLRGLVKMFRRRVRRRNAGDAPTSPQPPAPTLRARSASELAVDQTALDTGGPYNQGLSVSHDSVFSPDSPPDSGVRPPHPVLSLATRGVNMGELKAALRRRRGDDSGSGDDDPGFPRSPPTSPTTLDVLNHGLKSTSRTTHSTCSDGSLLSMDSSENDEDSLGTSSLHSSKHSLLEGRHQVIDREPGVGAVALNHQAARHKMRIRPRRNHAVPPNRKTVSTRQVTTPSSLPVTPEVNEDFSIKTIPTSPEKMVSSFTSESLQSSSADDDLKEKIISEKAMPERKQSIEKQDSNVKDEKKDEPLINRIFRASRKKSRSGGDSRENSVSPMRRGSDQRASREKKRDSSGSRLPFIGRRRQESPQYAPIENTVDIEDSTRSIPVTRVKMRDPSSDRDGSDLSSSSTSQRSSSVEGRLEGNGDYSAEPVRQANFQISSYKERHSSTDTDDKIRKVSSNFQRNIQSRGHRRNSREGRKSWLNGNYSEKSDSQTSSSKSKSFSSSYDSLDDLDDSSMQKSESPKEETKPNITKELVSKRSSDNLTSTPFSNIFIKSQNHSKKNRYQDSESKMVRSDSSESRISQGYRILSSQTSSDSFELSSGPHSLDSCLSSTKEDEEKLKKSASVDHVGSESKLKNYIASKPKVVIESKESTTQNEPKSPKPILRSISHQETESRGSYQTNVSRRESSGDELSSKVSKKEVKTRRLSNSNQDSSTESVPEFMRIHLNKIDKAVSGTPTTNDKVSGILSNAEEEIKLDDSTDHPVATLNDDAFKSKRNSIKIEEKEQLIISTENIDPKPIQSKTERSISVDDRGHKTDDEGSDKVVLRKPLYRTASVAAPKKSEDQPELLKVFARRSFKVKDSDKLDALDIDDEESELEEMNSEMNNQTENITVVSTPPLKSSGHILIQSKSVTEPIPKPAKSYRNSLQSSFTIDSDNIVNPPPSTSPKSNQTPTKPLKATTFQPKSNVIIIGTPSKNSTDQTPTNPPSIEKPQVSTTEINQSNNNDILASSPPSDIINSSIISNASKKLMSPKPFVSPNKVESDQHIQSSSIIKAVSPTKPFISSSKIENTTITQNSKGVSSPKLFISPTKVEISASTQSPIIVKPIMTSRGNSSLQWPPRSISEDSTATPISRNTPSPQNNYSQLSCSPQLTDEDSNTSLNNSETMRAASQASLREVSRSTNIEEARRRFSNVGAVDQTTEKPSSSPTTNKTPPVLAEARNTAPTFSVTVRTQPARSTISASSSDKIKHSNNSFEQSSIANIHNLKQNESPPLKTSTDSPSSMSEQKSPLSDQSSSTSIAQRSPSTGSASENWRDLVRQRKEDRLKQTKTPDSEEILLENRPNASRSSKVLEMASNFQKLQVA